MVKEMAKEIELKLRVLEASKELVMSKLKDKFSRANFLRSELRNIYYDTERLDLNRHKIAVRLRYKDEQIIQTIKTKGVSTAGLHQRGEWEWVVPTDELDVALLSELDAWPKSISAESLKPVFETNFVRHKSVIKWQGLDIELAYDSGEILVGDRTDAINEIELELVRSVEFNEKNAQILIDLGNELKALLSITPDDISKAERGYELYLATP